MLGLERATGLPALRLRMVRPYRIDLGFDLRQCTAGAPPPHTEGVAPPVAPADLPLAALVEAGLPLVERPFDVWAGQLDSSTEAVIATLQGWLASGTLRRWGAIVRHHEFGFDANAMAVFDVPDERVDACGALLARQSGVTLAYRRQRGLDWPYNLYCMVHGTDRAAVQRVLEALVPASGLSDVPQTVLFSRRRFKQVGARRFRELPPGWASPSRSASEEHRAVA
jgi:siroheme decarboxylase